LKTVQSLINIHEKKLSEIIEISTAIAQLKKEYIAELRGLVSPQVEIAEWFSTMINSPCHTEANLWLLAAQIRPSSLYIAPLSSILEIDNPCIWHEAIVDIMYDLASENSIPSLEKALAYHYGYDFTDELSIRILRTLAIINTNRAWEIIYKQLDSDIETVQETARLLIERKSSH